MSRIKVKFSKGMFPSESHVIVETTSGPVELFVDNIHLVEDELNVVLIDKDDSQALVKLPAEPLWGGKNVVVHLTDLVN